MVRVKICGITDSYIAGEAVKAGADALGFVFAESRRRVDPETARQICLALPPFINKVGVFVNSPAGVVRQIVDYCGLDYAQLHGDESPEYCGDLHRRVIKGVRVWDAASLAEIAVYPVAAVLLDTLVPGQPGGTGHSFDWRLVRDLPGGLPLILAGGLTPGNVRQAVRLVRPHAVDVSSGVETEGKKDPEKIRLFIRRAKEVI